MSPAFARSALMREEDLQRAVVGHLKVRCRPGVAWTHIPSGEARPHLAGARLVGLGAKPGWPDLQFIKEGRGLFLELKREGGRLSPAQVAAHAELTAAGANVAVAHGLDAALLQLELWGVLRSARP